MRNARNLTLAIAIVGVLGLGCAPAMGQGREGSGRGRIGGGFDPTATRYINPGTLAALEGFTHAVRVGQMVYVSGQVALDSMGGLVGPGDVAAQARQAFANLALVLDIAGVSPTDVVQLNVYVVGYKPADWALIRAAGAQFFPQRNPPAGMVPGVAALPQEGLLVAVDAVAVVKATFRPVREDRVPPPED
jgi:enamine deaminase RidA (YjgF/YER057c/UK114 family)